MFYHEAKAELNAALDIRDQLTSERVALRKDRAMSKELRGFIFDRLTEQIIEANAVVKEKMTVVIRMENRNSSAGLSDWRYKFAW